MRPSALTAALLAAAVLVGTGFVTGVVTSPSADARDGRGHLEHRHSQVRREQRQVRGDLEESSAALRRANRALGRAEVRLRAARAHLRRV
ncbi:MAG: hypothetical protein QM638_09065, partial [Nocardioides sp.]|uniref:hypothetical protein n=1 Tax=Nocardioides sp. TaxID=35761 RepID=UPI0039E241C7